MYINEKKALIALQNNPSEHVIAYYGSFQQGPRRTLISEYVHGGTLLDYLRSTDPPKTRQDIHDFWISLLNILKGLHSVHQITNHAKHAAEYRLVHEDLKPDNILLARDESQSIYQFQAKIADFGCSNLLTMNQNGKDRVRLDQHSDATYSAPESSHQQISMLRHPERPAGASDVWAMGCIFSEVGAWLVFGQAGVKTYLVKRHNEICDLKIFEGSDLSYCFHNGSEVLRAVGEMHRLIIESAHPSDNVTGRILEVIRNYMILHDISSRWQAKTLMEKFQHILDGYPRVVSPVTLKSPYPDSAFKEENMRGISDGGLGIVEVAGRSRFISGQQLPPSTSKAPSVSHSGLTSSGYAASSPSTHLNADQIPTRSKSTLRRLRSWTRRQLV